MREIIAILISVSLFASKALAEGSVAEGSDYRDVLRAFGPPKEKVIRESKREDLWIYSDKKVLFRNGVVVDILGEQVAKETSEPEPIVQSILQDKELVESVRSSSATETDVESILEDLMKGGSP